MGEQEVTSARNALGSLVLPFSVFADSRAYRRPQIGELPRSGGAFSTACGTWRQSVSLPDAGPDAENKLRDLDGEAETAAPRG